MAAALPFVPAALGIIGTLTKKKLPSETQYAAQMDPMALQYRKQLMQQMAARMGKPTQAQGIGQDMMNAMYNQYFSRPQGTPGP